MEIDPQQLGLEFGSGAVIGAIIGFTAKKMAKVIAVLVGLQLAAFRFLESGGYMTVHWDKLTGGLMEASTAASAEQPPDWMMGVISTLSIGAGFTGGFLVGFRRG